MREIGLTSMSIRISFIRHVAANQNKMIAGLKIAGLELGVASIPSMVGTLLTFGSRAESLEILLTVSHLRASQMVMIK